MNLNNLGDPPATTSRKSVVFSCIIILALVALLYMTGKLEIDRKWDEKAEGQHAAKPQVEVFMCHAIWFRYSRPPQNKL